MTAITDRTAEGTMRAPIAGTTPLRHHASQDGRARPTGLFPAAALSSPMFEGKDVAGLILAIGMALGPLAAYSFGWGA